MGEWPLVRLGDVVEVAHGWPFKSAFFSTELTGRPIVVAIGNFRYEGGFRFGETATKEYRGSYPEGFELAAGDLLVVMTCQTAGGEILGVPGRVPADGRRYLHNQRIGKVVIRDKAAVDPAFLYWLFMSSDLNQYLVRTASGTKILHTAPSRIGEYRFRLPPIAEQQRIASILGALDDKIELERRMSATLETIMRTAFGRLVESGTNLGWDDRGLDGVADFLNGLALQKYPAGPEGSLPVIKIAQLRSGDTRGADQAGLDLPCEYVVEDGDLLFSWSGSLECRVWSGGPGALNQHLFKVTPRDLPTWFVYQWILRHLPRFRAIAEGKATTMGHIQRHHLAEARVLVPPADTLQEAHRSIAPLFDQSLHRALESRSLALARDALLPRLLSGDLEVVE